MSNVKMQLCGLVVLCLPVHPPLVPVQQSAPQVPSCSLQTCTQLHQWSGEKTLNVLLYQLQQKCANSPLRKVAKVESMSWWLSCTSSQWPAQKNKIIIKACLAEQSTSASPFLQQHEQTKRYQTCVWLTVLRTTRLPGRQRAADPQRLTRCSDLIVDGRRRSQTHTHAPCRAERRAEPTSAPRRGLARRKLWGDAPFFTPSRKGWWCLLRARLSSSRLQVTPHRS